MFYDSPFLMFLMSFNARHDTRYPAFNDLIHAYTGAQLFKHNTLHLVLVFDLSVLPFIRDTTGFITVLNLDVISRMMWSTNHSVSASFCARFASMAAKSICPAGAAGFAMGLIAGADPVFNGLEAAGTGGLPGTFAAPGLAPTGGGLGFTATGGPGGFGADTLEIWEPPLDIDGFFHGVGDPLEGPMPGKTETGLADASADTEATIGLGAGGAGT